MTKKLINKKVILKLSDPWDLGEKLGWPALEADILHVEEEEGVPISIAIKLKCPFDYKNVHCEYFVASARLEGHDFRQLTYDQGVFCSLTRISYDQIKRDQPCDLSNWRGGIGLIGELGLSE